MSITMKTAFRFVTAVIVISIVITVYTLTFPKNNQHSDDERYM